MNDSNYTLPADAPVLEVAMFVASAPEGHVACVDYWSVSGVVRQAFGECVLAIVRIRGVLDSPDLGIPNAVRSNSIHKYVRRSYAVCNRCGGYCEVH